VFGAEFLAPVTSIAKDKEAKRCLESTCRNVPLREKLSAIRLPTKYMRGIVGGFQQGAPLSSRRIEFNQNFASFASRTTCT
jgi:hypothetical protein